MIRFFVLSIFLLTSTMLAHGQAASDLQVRSGDTFHKFEVEIADDSELIRLGLMNRDVLAENAGMLFDFEDNAPRTMWMKSTQLSLDMLFINSSGRVLAIARNAVPESERRIGISVPVRAVLELNANRAIELGIEPGDTVIHAIFGNTDLIEAAAE